MLSVFQKNILQIIWDNNGTFSWYQIDRALSVKGITIEKNLMEVLRHLKTNEIIIEQVGDNPSQPKYSLTKKGIKIIKSS